MSSVKATRKVEIEYSSEDLVNLIKANVQKLGPVVELNSRIKINVSFDIGSDPSDDGYGGGYSRQVLHKANVTVTALD